VAPFGRVCASDRIARRQDSGVPAFRVIGQSRCLVYDVSDYRVFVSAFCADISCEHGAGANSDTEVRNEQFAQISPERAGCRECRRRRVVDANRSAEYSQDGVTFELVDQAFPVVHSGNHNAEEVVQNLRDFLWWSGSSKRCGADQIYEKYGDLSDLAGQRAVLIKCTARHIGAHVAPKEVAKVFTLL
jgi:hypothetical protein